MASDRQKRIREHLAKSSGGEINFERYPQNYKPTKDSAETANLKTSKIEHIERSRGNYNLNSGSRKERKERIMNHIRLTRG